MTDYLLQQGREDYWPCLDLVAPLHQDFADRHRMQYVVHREPMLPDYPGHWDSVPLLLDLVQREDTGMVLWLDADTLIVGDGDPRDVLRGYDIAMARHPGPPEHYNCGVLMLQAGEDIAAWLQAVLDRAPGTYPWYQQTIMNDLLTAPEWEGRVKTLPHEWNSTVVLRHPERCIIRAWHGYPGGPWARYEAMRKAAGQ